MKKVMMKKRLAAVIGAAAMGFGVNANAAVVSFSDAVPLQSTNWSETVSVSKFDPSLGTLTSVEFSIGGHVEGLGRYESLDAAAATINLDLKSNMVLQRPDTSTLLGIVPLVSVSDSADAFDGTIDFDGPSGGTFDGLAGDLADSFLTMDAADLALFTGLGNIILPILATGDSQATGAGNIISNFSTSASAEVTVSYNYDPAVVSIPEPAPIALMGLGLLGLALNRRRLAKKG